MNKIEREIRKGLLWGFIPIAIAGAFWGFMIGYSSTWDVEEELAMKYAKDFDDGRLFQENYNSSIVWVTYQPKFFADFTLVGESDLSNACVVNSNSGDFYMILNGSIVYEKRGLGDKI